jgi:hypothetical protein
MQGEAFNTNLVYYLVVLMVVMVVAQVYVLLRIRTILHAVAMNFDSILHFLRKYMQSSPPKEMSAQKMISAQHTCQFCKHRLAYINTSQTNESEGSFYYRCGLRNINITLADSCVHFEKDMSERLDDENSNS